MIELRIRCTSVVHGAVDFALIGNIVRRVDDKGEIFAPTRTFDSSMKWILENINTMMSESPDLYFVR